MTATMSGRTTDKKSLGEFAQPQSLPKHIKLQCSCYMCADKFIKK
jgi:hypothetical protein